MAESASLRQDHRSDTDRSTAPERQPAGVVGTTVPAVGSVAPVNSVTADLPALRRHPPSGADPLGGRTVPPAVDEVLRRRRGQGAPLPEPTRARMSEQFQVDLSPVRVHDDAESHGLAAALQSVAFTHGSDIYFGRGSYRPESPSGQHVLAHELAHVANPEPGTAGPTMVGRADDPVEARADSTADQVVAQLRRSHHPDAGAGSAATVREGDAPTIRRLLSKEELAEARKLADSYDRKLDMAFYSQVQRHRQAVIDNATDAAFREVLSPYVTEKVIAYLKDLWKGRVSGNRILLNASNQAAATAIEEKVAALEQQTSPPGSAKEAYANLQLEATAKGDAWDKSLMTSDIALAIRQAAADLGIEKTAIKQGELTDALDSGRRKLRSAVEAGVRQAEDVEEPYYLREHGKDAFAPALAAKLSVYDPEHPADGLEATIRSNMASMHKGLSSETLAPVFNDIVAAAAETAGAQAKALQDPTYKSAEKAFLASSISQREDLVAEATREARVAIAGNEGDLRAKAAQVVSEGYIHSGLAAAAPVIEKLASKPDTNGKVTVSVDVPVKGFVVGFEFSCKVARDASDALSIAVELGASGGVGVAKAIKLALGAGLYLDAKSTAGAAALMDQVSMAFYRRFKDAGIPYTDYLWGLGGKTRKKGESEDKASEREAAAFVAMVEEQMGDKGEVETGGFVKGSASVDAGVLEAGIEAIGRSGTLLNKRAFTETKERKAATSGFTVNLTASVAPFSGQLTATIRNVTLAKPGGSDEVETTGKFGASLTGKVPGGAIFGSPAQTGVRIATWIAELVPKVQRIKELIEKKDPGLGDGLMAKSLKDQLEEAGNAAKAAVQGDWSKKMAEYAEASKTPGLTASSSGVTLGFAYAADKEGKGTGTIYLDLATGTTVNTGVAKIAYSSGERLWSHKLGG